jgi:dihydroorotate dehydrogenase electron transfer subunit
MTAPLAREGRVEAPFGRRTVEVVACRREGAYVVLQCHDPDGPRPAAGQFYMLASAKRWGGGLAERPFLPRAFSVMRAPSDGTRLDFMLEDVGPGTNRLGELGPEDALLIVGPLGNGFSAPRDGRRPLLVGGGVGTAPLAILQDQLVVDGGASIIALLGFRDAQHAIGSGLLADARIATDDGSIGHHGRVTELLGQELDADAGVEVFACGPPPMLEAVRAICAEREIPAQLALESGMACGFGACFGCVVPTRDGYVRVCVDGPVLDAARLETALPSSHPSPGR